MSRALRPLLPRPAALALVLLGLLIAGAFVWQASRAAFSAETSVGGNGWTAGDVSLNDNGSGSAIFDSVGVAAGDTGQRCITVTNDGDVTSDVRMYASDVAGTLTDRTHLIVTRGSGTAVDCSDFTADGPDLFTGTLDDLAAHDDFADGLPGAAVAPGAAQTFQIAWRIGASAPSGLSATTAFVWAARAG